MRQHATHQPGPTPLLLRPSFLLPAPSPPTAVHTTSFPTLERGRQLAGTATILLLEKKTCMEARPLQRRFTSTPKSPRVPLAALAPKPALLPRSGRCSTAAMALQHCSSGEQRAGAGPSLTYEYHERAQQPDRSSLDSEVATPHKPRPVVHLFQGQVALSLSMCFVLWACGDARASRQCSRDGTAGAP